VTDPGLLRVRTELVLDTLVGSLHEAASARAADGGLEALGWHARELELERFAPAAAPMPWLAALLAESDPDAVADDLAAREPLGRPDPGEAPSWDVPGPGGHVRHYLAMRAVAAAGVGDDDAALAAKRAWMRGFFRRCCDEV